MEPRRTRDEVVGHVWSFRDVTDRHRRRRRLERSNEDLERFASALSHDLREPMRMVTSFLELLERRLDDDLEGETRELLDHARGGAERASAMTESLLRLSSVGTSSDPLAPVDLDAVMEAAVDQLRLRIDETGAEVVADELPVVGGDRDQLTELLQNLVDNAIKYGPEDAPPRIEIRADEGPGMCTIRVADDGQGMDEATSGRAFGVFERGADADRTAEGIGMGLAICRRIVDRHGGEIWIEETAPGEGTTIAFTLPTAGSAADAPAGPPVPVAREG